MAQRKKTTSSVEHGTNKSIKEIKEFTQEQQKAAWAKNVEKALQLIDLENIQTKTYTAYNKESLRNYLKNPLSDSNSKNLRKLSQYLYVLSAQYRRIIAYFASQVDLTAYNVIPNISMTEDNDDKKILQNYESALKWLEKMNMHGQIYNIMTTVLREDVFYGYIYSDDSSEQDVNSFYILPLDPDYCRISSVNYDTTLNCAFDFSFFDNSTNQKMLEWWDKEFNSLYTKYKNDSKQRWAELDPDRTFVIKFNYDQTDRVIPPFASLFEDIIDLIDLRGLVSVKDQLDIYKLLVARIPTIQGTDEVNDFAVDLTTCVQFFDKMISTLPPEIGGILSPMEIEPINFEKSATDDTNKISNANKNLFESAGVSQVLDNSKLTGATSIRAKMIFDYLFSTRSVLPQIEARVNRWIDFVLGDNGMRVKYMNDVSPYLKNEKIDQVREAASLGLPVKLEYASLMGLSPLDQYSLSYLESNILKLQNNWQYPLQSSYTQGGNGNESGGQVKPIQDLTDDGEKSIDKRDSTG